MKSLNSNHVDVVNDKCDELERVFYPWSRDRLIVLWVAITISNILKILSLITWYRLLFKRDESTKLKNFWNVKIRKDPIEVEFYVLFILLLSELVALGMTKPAGFSIWCYIALYGLLDIFEITLDELLQPTFMGRVYTQNPSRWLIFSGINIFQVIICFAVFIKSFGNQFKPVIEDYLTAIYQSILTITTLGYGDHVPISTDTKTIVIFELTFFLLLIGFKLPLAVSVFDVKSEKKIK